MELEHRWSSGARHAIPAGNFQASRTETGCSWTDRPGNQAPAMQQWPISTLTASFAAHAVEGTAC